MFFGAKGKRYKLLWSVDGRYDRKEISDSVKDICSRQIDGLCC